MGKVTSYFAGVCTVRGNREMASSTAVVVCSGRFLYLDDAEKCGGWSWFESTGGKKAAWGEEAMWRRRLARSGATVIECARVLPL